jgi:GAF domain-containing protein
VDSEAQFTVVRASTGEVGQELLRRGHRLAVGSISVIGQVTDQGRLILARNTTTSQVHRKNEFLPDTLAELAIPLKIGDEVIGALDVQSREADVFTDDLIAVLQTLAEQIAIAIQSARLYEENRRRMAEIDAFNRVATLNVWNEYLRDERLEGLQKAVGIGETAMLSEMRERALQEGQIIVGDLTPRRTIPVAVPVMLRGQVLGAVEWELPQVGFGEDKLELAQELANRLAVSLENARLFAESRRATERERLVNTIATRLTSQPSLDSILQTAVREVGQALRVPQVTIRFQGAKPQFMSGTPAITAESASDAENKGVVSHSNGSSNSAVSEPQAQAKPVTPQRVVEEQ